MKLPIQLSILLGLLLTGCTSLRQEVAPIGLVQEPEKLVVACFISPQDTVLAARVTYSLPVLGTANPIHSDVTNATVTMSDGSRTVVLVPRRTTDNYAYGNAYPITMYRADAHELPIMAGKTYTLTVRVPDGRAVSATCTVPGPVALEQVTVDSAVTTEFGMTRTNYYAHMQWSDPAGQPNFYRVAGNNEFTYTYPIIPSPNATPRDTTLRMWGDLYFDKGALLTDIGRDGKTIASGRGRLSIVYSWINGQQQGTLPSGQMNVYLLTIDENYYRYHDAVERQNLADDNPFAEPVPIPTNVQNGLGCFGAYNRSTLTRQLK